MMTLRPWEKLPDSMRMEAVRPYYDVLSRHRAALVLKRLFDAAASVVLMVVLFPLMLMIAAAVRLDTPGPVLFFQERVTAYEKRFMIWKYRTMFSGAEQKGTQVTVSNDRRITRVGRFIRKCRLDELPQLVNIFRGDMSFVGTRPEVVRYVDRYTPEMMATLLLPAGVTSEASILYKDENRLLSGAGDTDEVYVRDILPEKMKYNLKALKEFSCRREVMTMIRTVLAMLGKQYRG